MAKSVGKVACVCVVAPVVNRLLLSRTHGEHKTTDDKLRTRTDMTPTCRRWPCKFRCRLVTTVKAHTEVTSLIHAFASQGASLEHGVHIHVFCRKAIVTPSTTKRARKRSKSNGHDPAMEKMAAEMLWAIGKGKGTNASSSSSTSGVKR